MREWRAKRTVPIGIRDLLMGGNLHAGGNGPPAKSRSTVPPIGTLLMLLNSAARKPRGPPQSFPKPYKMATLRRACPSYGERMPATDLSGEQTDVPFALGIPAPMIPYSNDGCILSHVSTFRFGSCGLRPISYVRRIRSTPIAS